MKLALLLLLVSSSVWAQQSCTLTPAQFINTDECPKPGIFSRAVHSEEFWWHLGHAAALGADLATTRKVLDTCAGCTETNPLFGKRPNLTRQLAIALPLDGALGYLIHHTFAQHKTLGRIASVEAIAVHGVAAVLNGKNIQ